MTADVIHTQLAVHHSGALLRRHISSNASDVIKSALVSPRRASVIARWLNLAKLFTVSLNGLRTAVVIWLEAIAAWHSRDVLALRFVDQVRLLFTQWPYLVASFALLRCLSGVISVN